MGEKIFLAGATGAIGTALCPLLVAAGYETFGTTRRPERAETLASVGVTPVIVDVFDAAALVEAVRAAAPVCVIHQLTDLPVGLDPARMEAALYANAKLREEGTRNLVRAAMGAGCRRIIAQSIAWAYRAAPGPRREEDPLDLDAEGLRGVSIRGVAALERLTLESAPLIGAVLRYGRLYGPGTGVAVSPGGPSLHVAAAARAALQALSLDARGAFNVVDDNDEVVNQKARRELRWSPEEH